jgi:hypothetical protein
MKKYLFITLVALCTLIMSCFAANPYTTSSSSFETEMMPSDEEASLCEAVANLRDATTPEEIEAATEGLKTVAKQDADNWLAHYHLAYAYGRIAHTCEKTKDVDGWVEKAEKSIKQASKCSDVDASEIHTLQAFLHYASIRVNPMIRGYKLSKTAMGELKSAVVANGNNPRAYLLVGQHLLNVPAMLGGDPDKACKYINASQKAYEIEEANEERDSLFPSWGRSDSDAIFASNNCVNESTSKRD